MQTGGSERRREGASRCVAAHENVPRAAVGTLATGVSWQLSWDMVRPARFILPFVLSLSMLVVACSPRRAPATLPAAAARNADRAADARTLAVYRTVADSIYVQTTSRPIAVVATTLDSSCAAAPCARVEERWGLASLWWSGKDSVEASSARRDLLANSAMRFDLRALHVSGGNLVTIEPGAVPIPGSDVGPWIAFRDGNHAAAGALQFSRVGFGQSGQTAIVFVDWRCGPACGHTLSVALHATSDSTWRIGDMLLLSSLQR